MTVVESRPPQHVITKCPACSAETEFAQPRTEVQVRCHACKKQFPYSPPGTAKDPPPSSDTKPRGFGIRGQKRGTDESPVSMEYYDLFEVPATATQEEIRKKYYKLAVKYHPDKNKDPDAEEHFKRISEAYQVLSDPALRKRYNEYGVMDAKPEGGFADPEEFFQQQFGGDRFVDIIGRISIGRDFKDLMDDGEDDAIEGLSEEEKQKRREANQLRQKERRDQEHRERVEKLVQNLTRKLSVFTETDCSPDTLAAFRAVQQAEAEELKQESHGVELLNAIGYTYDSKASQYLGRHAMLGLPGFFQRVREKGHILSETVSTIRSAIDLQRSFQQLQQADQEGNVEATERVKLEEAAARQGLRAMWKGSKLEVQAVLREVCDKVLTDPSVSTEKRNNRAIALKVLGEVYCAIRADPADNVATH